MTRFSETLTPVTLATLILTSVLADSGLPDPGFQIARGNAALPVAVPQTDVLHPDGVAWGVVGKNVDANETVENIEDLFVMAQMPGRDDHAAALTNFRMIASHLADTVSNMRNAS